MSIRTHNPRLAKMHRNYTVEEIASLYKVHKNTVREWIKQGLPTLNEKRPMLILGVDIANFLQKQRQKNKHPCQSGEIYCIRCRQPKKPVGNIAQYQIITEILGNLTAICPDCELIINRKVSLAKIEDIQGSLNITFPQALQHIVKRIKPTVNSDLEEGAK